MGMFSMRSPRRFHHEYIYANDRKQRLEEIEQRAKTSLEQAAEHSQVENLPRDADRCIVAEQLMVWY